jgi:anti-sigma regulatory factor (Ser/Thr protein kinase)
MNEIENAVFERTYDINGRLAEDAVWRNDIFPCLSDISRNIREVSQYGVCEILNNAIEHSGSKRVGVGVGVDESRIQFSIRDYGIGIFTKIQQDSELDDPRYAILELAKGKFTSDQKNHSGEGIFFTSRIFDHFSLFSGSLAFFGQRGAGPYSDSAACEKIDGTLVIMDINKTSQVSLKDIFNEYAGADEYDGFYRTKIQVKLIEYDGELLMSRSQARRLMNRLEHFFEVILDFNGVEIIGQAFADEIFRVFALAHPSTKVVPVNCADCVTNMIRHVMA